MSQGNNSKVTTLPKKTSNFGKSCVVSFSKMRSHQPKRYERKLFEITSKKYTLTDDKSLPINILKRAEVLLSYKHYEKHQSSVRFKQNLAIRISDKYKVKSMELKNRLCVNNPAFDIYAVTDVDEDYYKLIDGRPLDLQIPVFKSFNMFVNKILKTRQETGIKKNFVLNIETNYRNEMCIYDLSLKALTYQAKYFDTFISEDYQKSMTILAKWDKLKNQVDSKVKKLQSLATEKFTIQSRLIGLEYQYGLQQKYGRFLYYLSPPTWRLNNRKFATSVEIEAKGFDFGYSSDEDTFTIIFDKLRKICYSTEIKPVLYFTQPEELVDVFSAMENQQLHYFTHVLHLTPQAKLLKERMKSLKEDIDLESAVVVGSIRRFEKLLKLSEEKCSQLEAKFHKVLYGLFYDSVGSSTALKLLTHLEFTFEKIFFEKPLNMDILSVAKCLENLYTELSKKLDAIQSKTVRRVMHKCMHFEKIKAKRANNAARELYLFHRLEKALLRAHGFQTDATVTPLTRNTKKNIDKKTIRGHQAKPKVVRKKTESLTEAQIEYLSLFTEWTEHEDPANYLQSLNLEPQRKSTDGA